MNAPVITRFPPSPTGFMHIGTARTALYNHLFAVRSGGQMHLRFEDTDRERSKPEFEQDILAGLRWLGIPFDESGVVRQSQRSAVYREHLAKLIAAGKAYEAEESSTNPGVKVIRFKNPNSVVTFADLIRGEVSFDTTELKDFVIAKSMEEPLYHLAVVIDDAESGVTHVIRGEDHISNTPRQILILEALGFVRPQYAHIPLILAPDRSKLSKRHGAVSVTEYRAQGFVPEALINYLALLGWNPGGEQELFTLSELAGLFSLERVQKGGAVFDIEKLKWFNHEHLKRLSDEEYRARLEAFCGKTVAPTLVPLLKERAQTLKEATEALESELNFLADISYDAALLTKGAKTDAAAVKQHMEKVRALLAELPDEGFTAEGVKNTVFPYATEVGRAAVLWPLRVALSGQEKSPDPFTLSGLLGKEKTLERIAQAQTML
jgi:glutamyl-tRNA synthetase